MLVWSNEPKLITGIGVKPLYGYALGFPPTTVSYEEFIKNKNRLVEAPYTPEYLLKLGYQLNIRFTLAELRFFDAHLIRKIASSLGIKERIQKKGLIFKIREKLKNC